MACLCLPQPRFLLRAPSCFPKFWTITSPSLGQPCTGFPMFVLCFLLSSLYLFYSFLHPMRNQSESYHRRFFASHHFCALHRCAHIMSRPTDLSPHRRDCCPTVVVLPVGGRFLPPPRPRRDGPSHLLDVNPYALLSEAPRTRVPHSRTALRVLPHCGGVPLSCCLQHALSFWALTIHVLVPRMTWPQLPSVAHDDAAWRSLVRFSPHGRLLLIDSLGHVTIDEKTTLDSLNLFEVLATISFSFCSSDGRPKDP